MSAEKLEHKNEQEKSLVIVKSRRDQELSALIESPQTLLNAANLHHGPVHLLIPEVMDRQIARMRQAFTDLGLNHTIYFAHKACKSPAMVKQARKNQISLDVASKFELISGLGAGFKGTDIICTGPKNREFLRLALIHDCLISCDSEDELEKIVELLEDHPEITSCNILLRISNIKAKDRTAIANASRFGMPQEKCPLIFEWLKNFPKISLRGFHFHNDERNRDAKSGFVENAISLMEQAYEAGFTPDIIDMGGGLRSIRLADAQEWSDFIDQVAQGLLETSDTGTWRRFGLGMSINQKGAVSGRERIQGKYASDEEFYDVLKSVLSNENLRGRSLAELMTENGFSIAVEPGFAMLQQCGLTLFKVVGIKEAADGTPLILVNGNIYNLSQGVTEILYDPILIPQEVDEDDEVFEANIIGNMCREEDIITKRRIAFPQMPCEGDLICFPNTAAYNMDFEDTNPHQHPTGRRFVAQKNGAGWNILSEENYNPYNN